MPPRIPTTRLIPAVALGVLILSALSACQGTPDAPSRPPAEHRVPSAVPDCDAALVQRGASEQLAARGKPGAVVLLDARTGEEIALAQTDTLADVAVPPGSTLKPLLALAGLQADAIRPDETLPCDGTWEHAGMELTCFHTHGPLDLSSALATSCNAYAYEVARRVGPTALAEQYERVGLTEPAATIRSLQADAPEFYAAALGHAGTTVTPRALAQAWVQMLTHADPGWPQVAAGLRATVSEPHGTASALAESWIPIAGKTGTAEGPQTEPITHGWFAGFAPADSPRWIVVSYLQDAGPGGEGAAPLASDVLELAEAACPSG